MKKMKKVVNKKKVIKLYQVTFTVKDDVFLIHKYIETSKRVEDLIDKFKKHCRYNYGFNPEVLNVLDLSHISVKTCLAIRYTNTILCF